VADVASVETSRKRKLGRPDWHMRWPFALAYLAIVVAGFAVDWRVGLALLAWLPFSYLWWR